MQIRVTQIFISLFLILTASITFAQVPLYREDNVLVGANFNDGPGSSDMTLIMRLSGDKEIYVDVFHIAAFIQTMKISKDGRKLSLMTVNGRMEFLVLVFPMVMTTQ